MCSRDSVRVIVEFVTQWDAMKRTVLYSRAERPRSTASSVWAGARFGAPPQPDASADFNSGPSAFTLAWGWLASRASRHERPLLLAASALLALAAVCGWSLMHPLPRALSQDDIDAAVQYTIAHTPRAPPDSARAAAAIRPSVVKVEGFLSPEHAAAHAHMRSMHRNKTRPSGQRLQPEAVQPAALGSGVVVTESGRVLTALHVIASTDRWVVTFADGSTSDADFVGAQAENDLAVLQPKRLPDELPAATLASTAGLKPGDEVVATGFPFALGPSVSAGVVSALKREFIDPDNRRVKLTNLIQFDAAVNPGSSGGPLVNRDGDVIGIVTAIANPTGSGVFVGIAFAVPIENAVRAVGENPL
jgi:S1-C subfamily serine protease